MPLLLAPACSCEQQMREVGTSGVFECPHCDRGCSRLLGTCVNCKQYSLRKGSAEWSA